jgi:hypothetical protein
LESLALLGVVPPDRSLVPLEDAPMLKSARFLGFPKAEVERFYKTTGVENMQLPEPQWGR